MHCIVIYCIQHMMSIPIRIVLYTPMFGPLCHSLCMQVGTEELDSRIHFEAAHVCMFRGHETGIVLTVCLMDGGFVWVGWLMG